MKVVGSVNIMKKIFLLSPFVERKYTFPESSLNYIKFYLEDNGYQASVIDCSIYDEDYDVVIGMLKQTHEPLIGITAYTRERFHAYKLIKRIKKEIPSSLIVTGGHHFGFLAEKTLKELPEVDIVVRGEGEVTFKEVSDFSIKKSIELENIRGISYKKNGVVVHNPDRPLEPNIDIFRNYDHHNIIKYTPLFPSKVDSNHKYFTVTASRGCPNQCVFCSRGTELIRFRSVCSIVEEIKAKIEASGGRYVTFNDSSLTIRESFIKELSHRIIEENLDIKFNCYSRVNINTDILQLMKKAGLVSVEIGLESGSPKVLKAVKKNVKIEQFENFCTQAYKLGIKIYVFCMISLPDETLEDVDMTINLMRKMAPYITLAGMQTTRILPDAELYSIAKNKGIVTPDFSWFNEYSRKLKGDSPEYYRSLPIYYEHLKPEQIVQKTKEFYAAIETFKSLRDLILRKGNLKKSLRLSNYIQLCQKLRNAQQNIIYRKYNSKIKHNLNK
jgi:radical SAM superfamily enzyme YgiQ (UPF0313 family)